MKVALFALTVFGTPALAACPDPGLPLEMVEVSGPQMLVPQTVDVVVGGSVETPCDSWVATGAAQAQTRSFVSNEPTEAVTLSGMGPHILTVRARGTCLAALAVQSADGFWAFGEPKENGLETTLWGAPNGPLRVWVGSQTAAACDGTIELETYDR